ncbi:MAG: hypothetical protein C0410_07510 [Anaerolinea sp.]|nr:hypothetical protein [Anaerolinea sp.]
MRNKKNKYKNADYISYDRQTRSSWAILIANHADVPDDFKPFFQTIQETEDTFPYSVITPSYEGFVYRTQQRLVCIIDDCLYAVNKGETVTQALCLPFTNIQHIEFRTALLDSHLHITGLDREGLPAIINVRFNSVSDTLFKNIINSIRLFSFKHIHPKKAFSFDHLEASNYKMANFSRHCLLSEESVEQLIWQPELRQSLIRIHIPLLIHTFLYRTVFPHHVTLLTDQELILVRESERIVSNDCYGGVWDYLPLNKIISASISRDQDGFLTLSVELPNDQVIETMYLPSLHTELETLVNKLNQK